VVAATGSSTMAVTSIQVRIPTESFGLAIANSVIFDKRIFMLRWIEISLAPYIGATYCIN
jgi:hypothetical protein